MFARSFARRLALLGFQSWVLVLLSDNAAKKKKTPRSLIRHRSAPSRFSQFPLGNL
jgi:hypothetical protein